jgi:hypothetical protein
MPKISIARYLKSSGQAGQAQKKRRAVHPRAAH